MRLHCKNGFGGLGDCWSTRDVFRRISDAALTSSTIAGSRCNSWFELLCG